MKRVSTREHDRCSSVGFARLSAAICIFIVLLNCPVGASGALPVFDFATAQQSLGWRGNKDLTAPRISPDGLSFQATGSDPYLTSPAVNLSAAGPIYAKIKLRSEKGGLGQLYFYRDRATEQDSVRFEILAGTWTDAVIPLPSLGDGWQLRLDVAGNSGSCAVRSIQIEEAGKIGVVAITPTADALLISVQGVRGDIAVVELAPYQSFSDWPEAPVVARARVSEATQMRVPRFDRGRDRLYSSFVAVSAGTGNSRRTVGAPRFVEELSRISSDASPMPLAVSKKGLQVQMVEDAIALGIKHAAQNINLGSLIALDAGPETIAWKSDGKSYFFNRRYLDSLSIKQLSDAGIVVNLIVLHYLGNPTIDALMAHPDHSPQSPNRITAFNTVREEGFNQFKAAMEFLAWHFAGTPNGRVCGYIIGNEVNAHWEWYNQGPIFRDQLVADYLRTVRIAQTAVRKTSASARVYLSLTHHWTEPAHSDPLRGCSGKELIDDFNRRAKLGGDFDWHLAHHPYPENLLDPRTWLDRTALPGVDTPRITFKNLEVLDAYFQRPELYYRNRPRRIILSEQGFHCPDGENGEIWQAAGYCYAYEKCLRLASIDAFILHRHVDHSGENGLNLGLWQRQPASISTPARKRLIYEAFQAADTPARDRAFRFALPVVGINEWNQILQSR